MSVQNKKQERSKAKTAVSLASRRLIGAAHRGTEYDVLKSLIIELEKAYDDFCVANEEFELLVSEEENSEHRVVNGEDIREYRDNVNRCYNEAREVFLEQKAAEQEIYKNLAVEPARVSLKLDSSRIRELMETVDINLNSASPNKRALQLDKEELQSMLNVLCGKISELSLIGSSNSEQDIQLHLQIDEIIAQGFKQVRSINLYLCDCQSSIKKTPSPPIVNQVDTAGASAELLNMDPQNSATSSSQPVTNPSTQVDPNPTSAPKEGAVSDIPPPAVTETDTTINVSAPEFVPSTMNDPVSSSVISAQSTYTSPSPQAIPQSASTSQQTFPILYQHPTTSIMHYSPLQINPSTINPPHHLGTSTAPVYWSPPVNSTSSFLPNSIGLHQYPSNTQPHLGTSITQATSQQNFSNTNPYHNTPRTPPQSMYLNSVPSSAPSTIPSTWNPRQLPVTYSTPNARETYLVNPSTVPIPSVGPQPTPHHSPNPLGFNSHVQVKKMALPTFSGNRKEWPEFKAIWKSVAETAYQNKTALAHELKKSVKGEASRRIRSVYVTKPEAYNVMWQKLESFYEDVGASVQAALEGLHKIKAVLTDDYKGLVELVDEVESAYSQLEELGNLNTLTLRDVDFVTELLPCHLKVEWRRRYRDLTASEKIHPFIPFMHFLEGEREAVSRMAEYQPKLRRNELPKYERRKQHVQGYHARLGKQSSKKYYKCAYPSHRKDSISHITSECKEFQKLPVGGKEGKYELLKQIDACFRCFGNHRKLNCPKKHPCSSCGSDQHHSLLCIPPKLPKDSEEKPGDDGNKEVASYTIGSDSMALYPIHQATISDCGKKVSVFCDGGSNASYITHRAAERIKAKKVKKLSLDVTTMGNVEKTYNTWQYEFPINTSAGKKVTITAFGMERITGQVSKLDPKVLVKLFPEYDPETLQRKSTHVDVLLGCDYFGLHPKQEEARCGDNLSIMNGALGICLQGAHPDLIEETRYDTNLAKKIHDVNVKVETYKTRLDSHPEFHPNHTGECSVKVSSSYSHRKDESQVENFIQGEELATEISPQCGGCRCNKCPTVGHTYSFKEEQELKLIQENLEYDEVNQRWITSYPWLVDPQRLPDNYHTALATLERTERTLKKDDQWAKTYKSQMDDMVDRGVARKLSSEEVKSWNGPVFYISHLAVVNPHSNSTPVRIVFNSSQTHKGVSLNACLAKGPDSYMNNLVGILLRWREERVALIGDIRKMFNSVYLKALEQHCHRFLWRDLQQHRPPDVYVIQRVNMGDTPAPAISTEAIYKTAELYREDSPQAANLLKYSSYVDDLIDSRPSKPDALKIAKEAEDILAKGGFAVKCWQFSGETQPRVKEELLKLDLPEKSVESSDQGLIMLKGTDENLRVLGLGWNPKKDIITYEVTLNFSSKRRGVRTGPNLQESDLPRALPNVLTRRNVLEQVMKIYDPLGLISPFTLMAKIYLRETWSRNLGWDDALPAELCNKWSNFFAALFKLQRLCLERCLRPENSHGRPWLIILSDGSDLAYGFAAYIRWKLDDGSYWCRLIMAKCRIAPINKLSTPQMELNAAVLSKRGRKVLEKEMRFDFERVLQIVDSETVLSMIHKTSTRFKVYEGVRIGEIQAATEGDLTCWAWMSGQHNTADWLTRGRAPEELNNDSEWWNGPPIMYQPIESWGLKFGLQKNEALPGEKKIRYTATAASEIPIIDYKKSSDVDRIIWVVARILSMARHKSFRGGSTLHITSQLLREAEDLLVKDVQKELKDEIEKTDQKGRKGGRYASLNPGKDEHGYYVVGQRLKNNNPMTPDASLQKLLPTHHPVTRLFMERAHKQCVHRGRDSTLARFRQKYWIAQGSKIAQTVKSKCQLCKIRDAKLGEQEMGQLPEARLKPAPPFTYTMVDLFGPYVVRGEVQKRTSGKAYGVIFTDLVSRAVHIEAVCGYDTSSFLLALSRFASIRGWPEFIYSDPGSQLIGAERELKEAWDKIDRSELHKSGLQNGLTWKFGPADSPWYQGAVESLVKAAKRAIVFAVGKRRLTVPEFLTVCSEAANLLNERPIGTLPSLDSDLNVFTPNSLLLGRSTAKNPGGWQPFTYSQSPKMRYSLVQTAVEDFWEKWIQLYAPSLVIRRKWHVNTRNLRPGDVVMIADKNVMRGEYRLGVVKEAFPDQDGKVRRVLVTYKYFRVGNCRQDYGIGEAVTVSRSIQRLALLVPVEGEDGDNEDV